MIINSENIDAYHANKAVSKSKIMDYKNRGPDYYYQKHIARTIANKESPALRFGKLFDALTEDEEAARANWADPLPEDVPKRPTKAQINAKKPSASTLESIDFWTKYEAFNVGKEIIDQDERNQLNWSLAAMRANKVAMKLWTPCQKQVTVRHYLDALDIAIQSRPDGLFLSDDGGYIADIKTCADLNRFSSDVTKYGYHIQLAIGQWTLARIGKIVDAYLIVVESCEAPRCKVFSVPEVALSAGWQEARTIVEQIANRYKNNNWSEEQTDIEELPLAFWQVKKLEETQG